MICEICGGETRDPIVRRVPVYVDSGVASRFDGYRDETRCKLCAAAMIGHEICGFSETQKTINRAANTILTAIERK